MGSKSDIVARLSEKPDYRYAFARVYGDDVLENPDRAYEAMSDAIAAF